jgi:hypothetical protein
MNQIMLKNISPTLDMKLLKKKTHIQEESPFLSEFNQIVNQALAIANPKVLYKLAFVEFPDQKTIAVENVHFTSRVLHVNLEDTFRIFPFVATCGVELDNWAKSLDDPLHQLWVESIQIEVLKSANQTMDLHIKDNFQTGSLSSMSPGSLEDWPIEEQKILFQLLGDTEKQIGVKLTESMLMLPAKSLSGLRFESEEKFESCQLCPREKCPGRRVPYDKSLFEKKYNVSNE